MYLIVVQSLSHFLRVTECRLRPNTILLIDSAPLGYLAKNFRSGQHDIERFFKPTR